MVKNSPAYAGDAGDVGLIRGSGRSPGGINGNPLQYSCRENSMDRGAQWATVPGVTKSQTQPSNWAYTCTQTKHTVSNQLPGFDIMCCVLCCAWSLSQVRLFATLRALNCQAPLSMGLLQARILEWVAMSSSRGSSQLRDWIQACHIAGGFFTIWASREAQEYESGYPIPSLGDL